MYIFALGRISSEPGLTVPIKGSLIHNLISCEGGSNEYAT